MSGGARCGLDYLDTRPEGGTCYFRMFIESDKHHIQRQDYDDGSMRQAMIALVFHQYSGGFGGYDVRHVAS
jgi:hypothetical protein